MRKVVRTHQQVAEILTARGEPITKGGVFMAERSALRKLHRLLGGDPDLAEYFVAAGGDREQRRHDA